LEFRFELELLDELRDALEPWPELELRDELLDNSITSGDGSGTFGAGAVAANAAAAVTPRPAAIFFHLLRL
jgi:hypothetical protein